MTTIKLDPGAALLLDALQDVYKRQRWRFSVCKRWCAEKKKRVPGIGSALLLYYIVIAVRSYTPAVPPNIGGNDPALS